MAELLKRAIFSKDKIIVECLHAIQLQPSPSQYTTIKRLWCMGQVPIHAFESS